MVDFNKEEQKEIVKEAITEWLDSKYVEAGKWTIHGIIASAIAFLAFFLVTHGGFK